MRTKTLAALTGGLLLASGVAVAQPAAASSSSSASATGASAHEQHLEQRLEHDLAGLVSDGALTQAQAGRVASTLAADGAGARSRGGWGRAQLDAAAAALGTTPAQLRTELRAPGATPASVAKAHGVDGGTLVDALVTAEQTHLAERVGAGDLTQAQADQRLARFRQHLQARLDQPWRAPHRDSASGA